VSLKNRFTFCTTQGEEKAEEILRELIKDEQLSISEFQISRPDLETIFLRATKKNWEEQDYLGRKKKLNQQTTQAG
jgi:ABC-type uncharacterized transport system ATPase subunit